MKALTVPLIYVPQLVMEVIMLYQISNGAVSFGADTILHSIDFEIRNTEKIAIVGRNGCGKTTLLKLIAGEYELTKLDSDEDSFIAKAGRPVISYLRQNAFEDDSVQLQDEIRKVFRPILEKKAELERLLSRMEEDPSEENVRKYTDAQDRFTDMGGYDYEREYDIVFTRFGFTEEDKSKRLSEFSGGQKTKIAFVKLLLSRPDIMLLDEPTNHLDMATVEWLEDYLSTYPKAVVIVSHDRMFLDKVVDVVYEIEYGTAKRYPGNYTEFIRRKREDHDKQAKDYEMQQKEIARLQAIIDKFKNHPTKVSMARSKMKAIEHIVKIEPPKRYDTRSFLSHFKPGRDSGKDVLDINELKIGYDSVLSAVNFSVTKGQKLAVIGENGTGKSTLLKTIMGIIPALGGSYSYGFQVDVGYFDQQTAQYSSNKQVIDDFWDEFPDQTQTQVRSALGAFLFTQDDVFKSVNMLSGGEKARLALAKMLKRQPNLLILDEPTNHMDIVGKNTLENMLSDFTGTVIFVSHDRYFVRQIADSILAFENGTVTYYDCGYDEYMERKRNSRINTAQTRTVIEDVEKKGKTSFLKSKEQSRIEARMNKLESLIEECEANIQSKKAEQCLPECATDYERLERLEHEIQECSELEEKYMQEWNDLCK